MTLYFGCEVGFRITCSRCGRVAPGEIWKVCQRGEVPYPSLPHDWFALDGFAFCSLHVVEITDRADKGKGLQRPAELAA